MKYLVKLLKWHEVLDQTGMVLCWEQEALLSSCSLLNMIIEQCDSDTSAEGLFTLFGGHAVSFGLRHVFFVLMNF